MYDQYFPDYGYKMDAETFSASSLPWLNPVGNSSANSLIRETLINQSSLVDCETTISERGVASKNELALISSHICTQVPNNFCFLNLLKSQKNDYLMCRDCSMVNHSIVCNLFVRAITPRVKRHAKAR